MGIDLTNLKAKAQSRKKAFKKLFNRLERGKSVEADRLIQQAHEDVFACTDCLACANCCRTTGPLFTRRDIDRISGHLKMSQADFIQRFLKVDEDEDYVLQTLPCPFLNLETNMCGIYDVRPKACADYPLTSLKNQIKMKHLTLKNASICPAVYEILEKLSQES